MLSEQEETAFIELIGKMGTDWTPRLYNAMAPKFALTAVEAVCLRVQDGRTEILLVQRPPDDAYWPNQWHSPGVIVRASDARKLESYNETPSHNGFKAAFDRLVAKELGVNFVGLPQQVGSIIHRSPRGSEIMTIFLCQLDGQPKNGHFFDTECLPENIIDCHRLLIAIAVEAYKQGK